MSLEILPDCLATTDDLSFKYFETLEANLGLGKTRLETI